MGNNQPLVSVLMTSYNREKYIAIAIESVLQSDYRNFELIIVDDRSKDKTVDIANSYAAMDSRIKIFINAENLGDYPNRNRAASYATGKYLKYVDSDDYIYPWGLTIMVNAMEQFPEAGWGLCSLEQDISRPFPFVLDPANAYRYHYYGPGLFHKAPLSAIIRRDVFESVGGFSALRMVGDFEMWHKLAQKFPVVTLPHGMIWYRKHAEQEMNDYEKYLKVYESLKLEYLKSENCPLTKVERSAILSEEKNRKLRSLIRDILKLKFNKVYTYLKA